MAVVVGTLLIGCAVLLTAGASGARAEASQEEEQGRADAAKEQEQSGGAAPEGDRCEGTRINAQGLTNDVPGCPTGGPLSGTDEADELAGGDGEDEVRGLAAKDKILGGLGGDVIHGGPGNDFLYGDGGGRGIRGGDDVLGGRDIRGGDDVLYGGGGEDELLGGKGEDALYGGDGNDWLDCSDFWPAEHRDEIHCGEGIDHYVADKLDRVSNGCEKEVTQGPPVY